MRCWVSSPHSGHCTVPLITLLHPAMILPTLSTVILPLISFASANLHDAIDTYIVQTEYGNIRGYSKLVLGKKLYIFSGIPYAQPPVGRRRFRKPSPINPWDEVLDGTKLPNTCVQVFSYFVSTNY